MGIQIEREILYKLAKTLTSNSVGLVSILILTLLIFPRKTVCSQDLDYAQHYNNPTYYCIVSAKSELFTSQI
jgi:hypothetical protein